LQGKLKIAMIKVDNRVCNNNLSKEELIERIIVSKTSYADAPKIVEILARCFDLPSQREALRQLLYSNANLDESIKLVDKETNDIYGLLILSDFPIHIGSPLVEYNYNLAVILSKYKQLNGHSFLIDERLRGTSLDKKMISFNKELYDKYDIIWCAVENDLKSHNYWKRLGFTELFTTSEAKFYTKYLNKNVTLDIYKDEAKKLLVNEKDNY
jgi:hypothetical protein